MAWQQDQRLLQTVYFPDKTNKPNKPGSDASNMSDASGLSGLSGTHQTGLTKLKDCTYHIPYEAYLLLVDSVDLLVNPAWVKKYLVDFLQHKQPCCCRTVNFFLTQMVGNKLYDHLTNFVFENKTIRVLEIYEATLAAEHRRYNDAFGRSMPVQVKLGDQWVPTTVCQIMFCSMLDRMHFFDLYHSIKHIVLQVMRQSKNIKKRSKPSRMVQPSFSINQTNDSNQPDQPDQPDQPNQPNQPNQADKLTKQFWINQF